MTKSGKATDEWSQAAKSLKDMPALFGSQDGSFTSYMFYQTMQVSFMHANPPHEKLAWHQRAISEMLHAIAPANPREGMIAAQMVAAHEAAMECYRRAALPSQTFEGRNMALKHAAKMSATFAELMATLDKHRGKGQQKVEVRHVHIHEGGQAIVGNVEQASSRLGWGWSKPKNEDQPHAKQIAHAPEAAIPCQKSEVRAKKTR